MTGFVCGAGNAMRTLDSMVGEIARTDIPILLIGESGTGKDTYAKLIHRLSPRYERRLQKINCGSFDPGLFFDQVGLPKQCSAGVDSCGTLYLDNAQELDIPSQGILLSRLFTSETMDSSEDSSIRLISSTAITLESELQAGRFRRELYFRLNGACLRLPPLRERTEDIPVLAEYFLNKHSRLLRKDVAPLAPKAIQTLSAYHWPGNVRELENVVRNIAVFGDAQMVLNDLQTSNTLTRRQVAVAPGASLKVAARAASKQAERELIVQALERTRWNRKRAARELQISYKSLLYKIKQIGMPETELQERGRK